MNSLLKSVAVLITSLNIISCTPPKLTVVPAVKAPKLEVEHHSANNDIQQHVAISLLAAGHYCAMNNWPVSITTMKEFQKKFRIPIPVNIQWDWLSDPKTSYVKKDNDLIITTHGRPGKPYKVISTHKPPNCDAEPVVSDMTVTTELITQK